MIPNFDITNPQVLNAGNRHTYTVTDTDQRTYNGFLNTGAATITVGLGDNIPTYTTTGATQVVTTAIDDIVYYDVASGATGTGTLGHYYKSKTVQASLDLNLVLFATDTTNWEDLGISTGDEVSVVVVANEEVKLNGGVTKVVASADTTLLFTY
jgi:hypothetical protein